MVTEIIYRGPYRGVYGYVRDLGRDFSSPDVAERSPRMTKGEREEFNRNEMSDRTAVFRTLKGFTESLAGRGGGVMLTGWPTA